MPRNKNQALRRERETSARHREIYRAAVVECRPRPELAKRYKITERHLLRIISEQDRLLRQNFPEHIARIKDRQTARLEFIYEEAIQAWERSKSNATTVSETEVQVKLRKGESLTAKPAAEKKTITKGQVGDASYLDTAMKALADIRKIWGVESPVKFEVQGNVSLVGGNTGAPSKETIRQVIATRILTLSQEQKARDNNDDRNGHEAGSSNGHTIDPGADPS